MIATSGFLTALECTKLVFGWGSALNPAGGAYCAPPDPIIIIIIIIIIVQRVQYEQTNDTVHRK